MSASAFLVVDDEPGARADLIALLRRCEPTASIREAATSAEAQAALGNGAYRAVFLDIQLGSASGFDVLPFIPRGTPVIFVTAYEQFAVRAFEVDAVDYLLKPVDPERLRSALARTVTPAAAARFDDGDWLFLPTTPEPAFVQIRTITHIRAEGDYTFVHTSEGGRHIIKRALNAWEERLGSGSFVRIHRSTIVNLAYVLDVARATSGTHQVRLRGVAEPLPMSRSQARRLAELLK